MAGYNLPSRQLVSQQDQSMVQRADIPRSQFLNKWTRKTTFSAGLLVPFLLDEVYPGDHFNYKVHAYVRTDTPLFPIMDSQRIDTFFFFVPNRIVWDNWVRMMGQQDNPTDSIAYTVPQMTTVGFGFAVGSVGDHFGFPTIGQPTAALSVSALPWRAYATIYNQWFRDENLIPALIFSKGDAATTDVATMNTLRRRAKSHDYFTSALPWPQKFTAPLVFGSQAPIRGLGVALASGVGGSVSIKETPSPTTPTGLRSYTNSWDATAPFYIEGTSLGVPQVFADLSALDVNVFRQAYLVQQLLERDARGGTRYTELNLSHFGVRSPDARLQRAEYLGGGSTPLEFTPIAQTAPGATPVGALGATGTAFGSHGASYAATEHGMIIGLINIKSELSYSQGIHRSWSRLSRLDFMFPSLTGLGEQAILRKEIYATGDPANDDVVFGYQERFQELRTRTSEVTGLFRPTAAGTIDQWHLSQEFTAAPVLGQTFIEDNPPMDRVLSAGALAIQYRADILIDRKVTRALPPYGTPALLGRF